MPLVGLTSFLQVLADIDREPMDVSMPLVGLTSFLLKKPLIIGLGIFGVNALSRAHIISTCSPLQLNIGKTVSMPLVGLISFLRALLESSDPETAVCQCP